MPRQAADPTLMLPERELMQPATRWLYAALRHAILQGRLRPGKRLPATRELARRYGLSRGGMPNACPFSSIQRSSAWRASSTFPKWKPVFRLLDGYRGD
jgi:DNA-binding transcriptional MocR family regulator